MITKLPQSAVLYGPQASAVSPGGKTVPGMSQMAAGKMMSATVVETPGQNMFTLETSGGMRLGVQSSIPLAKGEQIQFQVLSTQPVLELQKVDTGFPVQARQSFALAGDVVNVKPLLQDLQTSLFAAARALSTGTASPTTPQPFAQPSSQIFSQTAAPVLQKMDATAVDQLIRQGNYTVKATVVENLGDNKALVQIAGKNYQLSGLSNAQPGESKVLQLQSLEGTPRFFPVGDNGVVNKSQPLLLTTQNQSLPALVRALQLPFFTGLDLLQPAQQQTLHNLQSMQPSQLQKSDAGELLKSNLGQLGTRSETLVAQGKGQEAANQLKSILGEVMRIFQGQESITSTASRLLATLESSQFVQANLQQENTILFPLPFSFLEKGYLMVDQEAGQQNGNEDAEDTSSCTLHLELEGLGDVRVRCVQSQDSIRIAFFLESQDKTEFVSAHESDLKENISSAPLLSLSFATGAGSPGAELLQQVLGEQQSLLNTIA